MEQKIKNEWEKVKDFNIFQNIEDFSKLFKEKPNGSCFKKYTSYPWCKENFFFGSYDELLNFYKTSFEVPFYLEKRIGEKFGQLIIKSFVVKLTNGKRKIFAKCLCDCGNECEKDFHKMLEGRVKSCGNHKEQKKNDLLSLFPDIIKDHWDYEKNKDLPENVKVTSDNEYWWVDDTGSFLLKPSELTKKKFGTSFHEQCIYYYCKQLFNATKNRYRFKINNISTETDIYIPEINVAIEYDGVYWHKTKESADLEKTNRLNSQNVFLIRVREKGLNVINNTMTKTIVCDFNDDNFYITLKTIVNTILKYVIDNKLELEEESIKRLKNFKLSADKFEEDKLAILNQYRTNYVNDNITKTCLIKYWDYDKNKAIIPQKVSVNDDIKVWFTCNYKFSRKISVKSICDKHTVSCGKNKDCLNCNSIYCPFAQYCNRWYGGCKNHCKQMLKYYYYRAVYPNKEHDKIDECYYCNEDVYKQYIGKQAINNDDNFYNAYSLYKYYLNDIKDNKPIPNMKYFKKCELNMSNFTNFNEVIEFINLWHPYIERIEYKDFDTPEIRTQFLEFMKNYMIDHRFEITRFQISGEEKLSNEMIKGLIRIIKRIYTYRKNPDYLFLYNNFVKYLN